MSLWERRRILIWGKTRPELSTKHCETVCTGGVFAESKAFVRLYPIPLRYLDDEKVFRKYQWIEADVRRGWQGIPGRKAITSAATQSRPARPFPPGIKRLSAVRAESGSFSQSMFFPSVQTLQESRELHGTSIGMIRPDEVIDFPVHTYPAGERVIWLAKYRQLASQRQFDFDPSASPPVRPISPPDFRFKIKFKSGDDIHTFSVFDWEIDALYYRCRRLGDSAKAACEKVVERLRETVCSQRKDTYFFLGNIFNHPHKFTIVGLWYPTKRRVAEPLLFC